MAKNMAKVLKFGDLILKSSVLNTSVIGLTITELVKASMFMQMVLVMR